MENNKVVFQLTDYLLDAEPVVEGFDTETLDGYVYLICSSSRSKLNVITESNPSRPTEIRIKEIKRLTTLEILDFIVSVLRENSVEGDAKNGIPHRTCIGFFYNVNFDFGSILKQEFSRAINATPEEKSNWFKEQDDFLLTDDWDEIDEFKRMKKIYIKRDKKNKKGKSRFYEISYVRNKGFKIKDENASYVCFDISNLTATESGRHGLDALGQELLGEGKVDTIDRKRLGTEGSYWSEVIFDEPQNPVLREGLKKKGFDENLMWRRERIKDIEIYCKHDADLTRRISQLMIRKIDSIFGIYPKYYYSNASIAKAYLQAKHGELKNWFFQRTFKKNGDEDDPSANELNSFTTSARQGRGSVTYHSGLRYPNDDYISLDDINLIFNCYSGGIFDGHRLGRIRSVTELDINSAYPYEISSLPRLVDENGKQIVEVRRSHEYHTDAMMGFYRIEMKYDEKLPFPYAIRGRKIYPSSYYPQIHFKTKLELDYLTRKGIKFTVLDSFEIYGDPTKLQFPEFPELFAKRNEEKRLAKSAKKEFEKTGDLAKYSEYKDHDITQWNIKIPLNATYGALFQIRDGLSDYTNFIYGAYITAWCRVRMYELIDKVGIENVVAIATDALFYIDLGQDVSEYEGDQLGQVKKEFEKLTMTVYMNGLYVVENEAVSMTACVCPKNKEDLERKKKENDFKECPRHEKFKKRGFPSLQLYELDAAKGQTLKVTRNRPHRLLTALVAKNKKKAIEMINTFEDEERTIDLESVKFKREVAKVPTFEELRTQTFHTAAWKVHDSTPVKDAIQFIQNRLNKNKKV